MMRSAHDDDIFVRKPRIEGIIFIKGVIPHGRPEIVCLEAQKKFEDLGVKLVIVISEFFLHPTSQSGCLVVEKDATVFHGRRSLCVNARLNAKRVLMMNWNVGPPVPRGDANLFGEVVDTVNGAALVASGNDQGTADAWQRMGQGSNDERLPFAGNCANVDPSLTD